MPSSEALNGVYTLAKYSNSYPLVLDLTYPISERSGGEFVLNDVEIGSICVAGDDIFVSWFNHNTRTYGVDKIDYLNKLDGAYLESIVNAVTRREFNNFSGFLVAYNILPTDTGITIYYSLDYGATWVQATSSTDTDRRVVVSDERVQHPIMQMRMKITAVDNDAPVIESAGIFYE